MATVVWWLGPLGVSQGQFNRSPVIPRAVTSGGLGCARQSAAAVAARRRHPSGRSAALSAGLRATCHVRGRRTRGGGFRCTSGLRRLAHYRFRAEMGRVGLHPVSENDTAAGERGCLGCVDRAHRSRGAPTSRTASAFVSQARCPTGVRGSPGLNSLSRRGCMWLTSRSAAGGLRARSDEPVLPDSLS